MNQIKRLITCCLVACILLMQLIPVVYATNSTGTQVSVCISDGETQRTYSAIAYADDLYFPAESFGEITNYRFTNGQDKYGYILGRKILSVEKNTGKFQIMLFQHEGTVPIISKDGTDYLSASALLPWMNVRCTVDNGILEILPDGLSIWEVVDNFNYSDYMFNVYQQFGDSTSMIVGWEAMTVFDTIINLRWNRLIPADISFENGLSISTMYDRECYVDILVNLLNPEIAAEKYEKALKETSKWNNYLDDYLEERGIDEKKIQLAIDDYYRICGDYETGEMIFNGTQTWLYMREFFRDYKKVTKYLDVFHVLKMCEIVFEMDTEYREFINWLADQSTGNTVFDEALNETSAVIDENSGVITAYYLKLLSTVVKDIPKNVFDAIANNTMNDTIIELCNGYKNGFFGSLDAYMDIAKVVYSTILPVAGGYEEMAKIHVTETIQDYCWELAQELENQTMTKDNILRIRQSYLTALRTSKLAFEGKQELIDVKAFGVITIFDGEGLMDGMLNRIDDKILDLAATVDATENDSIEGKGLYSKELKTLFSQIVEQSECNEPIGSTNTRDVFNETYWHMSFGQSLGYNYVAKFSADGTFVARGMGSGAYKNGTYTYSDGKLVIIFDIDGFGHPSTIEYSGNQTGFTSLDKYPMQVGEAHYSIVPDADMAQYFNKGLTNEDTADSVLADGEYYGRLQSWDQNSMTVELFEFLGWNEMYMYREFEQTGKTVTLDIDESSVWLEWAWGETGNDIKCKSIDAALNTEIWGGGTTVKEQCPMQINFAVKNGIVEKIVFLYAA